MMEIERACWPRDYGTHRRATTLRHVVWTSAQRHRSTTISRTMHIPYMAGEVFGEARGPRKGAVVEQTIVPLLDI